MIYFHVFDKLDTYFKITKWELIYASKSVRVGIIEDDSTKCKEKGTRIIFLRGSEVILTVRYKTSTNSRGMKDSMGWDGMYGNSS